MLIGPSMAKKDDKFGDVDNWIFLYKYTRDLTLKTYLFYYFGPLK